MQKLDANIQAIAKKILLVEDTIEIRILLSLRLRESGFEVWEAENGKEALECLRQSTPDLPDLIVSDFLMPIMNGLELCRMLKQDTQTQEIPILMLSSFPFTQEALSKMKQQGIDAFMMKPYSFDDLLECVDDLLKGAAFLNVKIPPLYIAYSA